MGPGLPVRPIGPAGPRSASYKRKQGRLRDSGVLVLTGDAPRAGKARRDMPRTGAPAGGVRRSSRNPAPSRPWGLSQPRIERRRRRGDLGVACPRCGGGLPAPVPPSWRLHPAPARQAQPANRATGTGQHHVHHLSRGHSSPRGRPATPCAPIPAVAPAGHSRRDIAQRGAI